MFYKKKKMNKTFIDFHNIPDQVMKMTAPFIHRWAQTKTQNWTTNTMMWAMWGTRDPDEKILDWKQQERKNIFFLMN